MPRTGQVTGHKAATSVLCVLGVACCGLAAACGGNTAGPSQLWRRTVPAWSPYVVVFPDRGALTADTQALGALAAHGAVRGVRIQLLINGDAAPAVSVASSLGLEVLGIIADDDLRADDVEGMFDRYRALYPGVNIFQIGNEVTTLPGELRMSISQYMDIFERVYAYATARYPEVTLLPEATFGAGTIGADDLAAMAPRLERLSKRRIVIGLNAYTDKAMRAYAEVLARSLAGFRVWITETGVADPPEHASYVQQTYPRLRDELRAERIYWFALWAGDTGDVSGYGLIRSATHPPITPQPLFTTLTTP